jgi:hypothetical protein
VKPQESFTKAIKKFQSNSKKQGITPAKKARKEQLATSVAPPVTQTRSGCTVKAPTRNG